MSAPCADSGSFRDDAGRVFILNDRIFRTVMPSAKEDFDFVRSTGLVDELIANGDLIAESPVDREILGDAGRHASYVLEHPKLPFVSYPYEWPFAALKAAALLHLNIHLAALDRGVTMTDATAYNIQFQGAQPVFIDGLSFRRYIDGEYWSAHRQFCDQFINPLLLTALLGVPHNAWYRGALEGLSSEVLNNLLPWHKKLSWNVFTQVSLQARFQRSSEKNEHKLQRAQSRKLPLGGFQQILIGLRNWILKLEPKDQPTTLWAGYADDNSYAADEADTKREFVADFVRSVEPKMVWDLGCNTGDNANLAFKSGAQSVVGFDFDLSAVQTAFERSKTQRLNFLPLVFDAVNPSPAQGWAQSERQGFMQRLGADALIALALIHHLVIAKNIPLDQTIEWLVSLAPHGVIEFVQKSDPMVQRLLRLRDDIFNDYDQDTFEQYLRRHAKIVKSINVSAHHRRLYWYSRSTDK